MKLVLYVTEGDFGLPELEADPDVDPAVAVDDWGAADML